MGFTEGFLKVFGLHFSVDNLTNFTLLDTGDVSRTFGNNAGTNFQANAAAGGDTLGIVVGTDPTVPAATDNKLLAQIAHGNLSGQLAYGAMGWNVPTVLNNTVTFIFTRAFTNNSGAGITVKEVGIYSRCTDTTGTSRNVCMARDLIASGAGELIPSTETRTVTYTLTTVTV